VLLPAHRRDKIQLRIKDRRKEMDLSESAAADPLRAAAAAAL